MTVVSLPLQFQNSFWSQDYRKGLEVLYSKLEQGIVENAEIVAFIRTRAAAEAGIAAALTAPTPGEAFDTEDGLSLHTAFRGLKEESVAQGKVHETIATDLQTKIADPFEAWANGYKDRLLSSHANIVDGYLRAYERAQLEVADLKSSYLTKTRKADEAEDDARFAPIAQATGDKYTTSPNLGPRDKRTPQRQPTMSERISQRLKDFRLNVAQPDLHDANAAEVTFDADVDEKPKVDKGKGRAIDPVSSPPLLASPPPLSPQLPPARLTTTDLPPPGPPITVAGVSFTPTELSTLMAKAKGELNLRPVRFPLLGEYQDAFTGEEFATWLKDNVKAFEGNLDRAEDAAKYLTERLGALRRLGEFGNEYVNADDAYYQFRPKAFNLEAPKNKEDVVSPLQKNLSPLADNVAKRTTTFANLVSKALNANTGEPVHIRARREAENADLEFRVAIRKLDRQRLGLEERIEDVLKTLQKWELDRLRAVRTVMSQYQACLEGFPGAISPSFERSATLVASYQPEADLRALIEQYRTGPFRPEAQTYESVAHDESDVVFGIDLRKWADLGTWNPAAGAAEEKKEPKDLVPPTLGTLLHALKEAYASMPSDSERRKTWIYEVPLPAVHHLRETLNNVPPEQPIPDDTLVKYDPPVLAGGIKLWLLELDPPLCLYEGWDDLRKLYPSVGRGQDLPSSDEQHVQELQAALQKLPMVHLVVLDTIVQHLRALVEKTQEDDEPNEVYITKLALSVGRSILRPKTETKFSIQDRHPTLLFIDLMSKYNDILPPTIAKKKRESERKVPVRRRTRPMDMRMSRSRISAGMDLKELHAQQLAQRMGKPVSPPASVPSTDTVTEEPENLSDVSVVIHTAEPEEITVTDKRTPPSAVPPPPSSFVNVPPPPPVANVVPPPPTAPSPVIPSPQSFANIPPPPPIASTTKPKSPVPPPHVPSFKEPPPENDDLPPRPTFKEPPAEIEVEEELPMPSFPTATAVSPPPAMPKFVDPPSEPPTPPAHATSTRFSPSSSNSPTPTSLSRATSPKRRQGSVSSSRSMSPNKSQAQEAPQAQAQTQRNGSLQRSARLSGPRGPGGGAVGNIVKNFNRNSMGSSPPGSGIPRPGSPATSVSARNTHAKRSSASRTSMFERRTMASDAEEEIVQ